MVANNPDYTGLMILFGLFGLALIIASFVHPAFGFYTSIVLGFTISVAERIIYGIITFDFYIEILTYATFAGLLFRNHLYHEGMWKRIGHPLTYFLLAYFLYLFVATFNPNASSVSG